MGGDFGDGGMNNGYFDPFSPLFAFVAPFWIMGWITASIIYRKRTGKPFHPKIPEDAIFYERAASGYSCKSALTRIGGARRCLLIAVTNDELIISPAFPFNLMFLPEIYGLEFRVSRSQIRNISEYSYFMGRWLTISFTDGHATFKLSLKNTEDFLKALAPTPQ